MKQATIQSPTTFLIEEVPRPQLKGDGDILVRTAACGICSGDLMEWYLERKVGSVLGHEMVGYVEEAAPDSPFPLGEAVFVHHHAPCLVCKYCRLGQFVQCETWKRSKIEPGGMAEFFRVPSEIARVECFAIPDLDPEVGIFIEPLACCVKCLSLVDATSDFGIVVGCGIMGLLNIQAARALGTKEVWGVEPDETRRRLAHQLGATRTMTPDAMEEAASRAGFPGADYVIVGPGLPEVIVQSLQYVRPGGTILLFAPTPPKLTTVLDLGDVYFREIRIIPSYSCGPKDTRKAYDLLRTGKLDPRPIITHRFPLPSVQAAYNTAKRGGTALKVIVEFPRQP